MASVTVYACTRCVCCQGCGVCGIGQSTKTTTTTTTTRPQGRLVDFVVNKDGIMIAVYNHAESTIIKLKDISTDDNADWYLSIRPEVGLRLRSVSL